MKTDNDNIKYDETLARYLSGEMSMDESGTFEKEISMSEEENIRIKEMKNQWKAIGDYKEAAVPDTQNAWTKLHSRFEQDNLLPLQKKTAHDRKILPKLLKAAALILILVGIGAALYYTNSKHTTAPEMVLVNTDNEANTLVKTLSDGSVIYLSGNSLFSFPNEFETDSRNVELKGEAFFDITHDPAKPFIVETTEAYIQVLGTAFTVKTKNGNDFKLCVERGKVKVTLKNSPPVSQLVEAGEQITATDHSLVKSKYINPGTLWYRQRMHFKDESLQSIINVLNRNFNTTFAVAQKETGQRRLTVTFDNESAETMTELLCAALNLKSQTINGSVVLSENTESAKHR